MARRSPATVQQYAKRERQLRDAAALELGEIELDDAAFVTWLIEKKRPTLRPASWRLYRAAVLSGLDEKAAAHPVQAVACRALATQITDAQAIPRSSIPQRTSSAKAKRFARGDLDRIIALALSSRSPHAAALGAYLQSTRQTGLRPVEWATARLAPSTLDGFERMLIVCCAKHDEVRAHSEIRTLHFTTMPLGLLKPLTLWLAIVSDAVKAGRYETLIHTIGTLMRRMARRLFPRRKKHPTLYTARHEAAAILKAHYIESKSDPVERSEGAAVVAALLGHASDVTATRHYGRNTRRRPPSASVIPVAHPAEVARVSQHLSFNQEKFHRFLVARSTALVAAVKPGSTGPNALLPNHELTQGAPGRRF